MWVNIFEHQSYRKWLGKLISHPEAPRGLQTRLAESADTQKSYFSLVLQEKVHLSADQILLMARYLELQETEENFLMELWALERASTPLLRERQEKKLQEIRREHERLASRFDVELRGENTGDSLYYSSWHYGAIHLLVSLPHMQSASAIAQYLKLDFQLVQRVLLELRQMGFVTESKSKKGQFEITKKNLHLARGSHLFTLCHTQWRLKAMQEVQSQGKDSLHYNSLYTLSTADYIRLKELFLNTIDQTRKIVAPSPDETLVCLAMDLFEIK